MDTLRMDLRQAIRSLRHRPGASALAVLTLAVGIGVNAVAFSAINGLLLKPFRFDGIDRLGWVMMTTRDNPHGQASLPDYEELARENRTFETLAAEGRLSLSMREQGPARQVWALAVSRTYLPMLGVSPRLGRVFAESDLHAPELPIIVSERFWSRQLGGGSTPGERHLVLNGQPTIVIGVLPDDFQGPGGIYEPEVWVLLERLGAFGATRDLASRERPWLTVIGRLKTDANAASATRDVETLARHLAAALPDSDETTRARFVPMTEGHPELRGIAPLAWTGLGIVAVVLLIACFNVAGLLMARAAERQRELAVRSALGASRGRLIRQLVLEAAVLAALGGLAALLVAAWSADLLATFRLPAPIPQRLHMSVDRRLLLFTAWLVGLASLVPALIPAMHATRAAVLGGLKGELALGVKPSLSRNLFVVAQIGGSTLFLAAALLFARSFWTASRWDPGFETTRLLSFELDTAAHGYDAERSRGLVADLLDRLGTRAGIEAVTVADRVPFFVGAPKVTRVDAPDLACDRPQCRQALVYAVGAGHFRTLGIPLRAGRDFTGRDIEAGGAAIISETMAAWLWPGEPALGRWIREEGSGAPLQVIGVAADVAHRSFNETPGAYLYRPLRRGEYGEPITVAIRTAGDPRLLMATIRDQMRALAPDLPVSGLQTMAQRMEVPLWPSRTSAGAFAVCAALALVLAATGLFGVTYHAVSQRTREFGVRIALGATGGSLLGLVVGEGLRLAVPGILAGVAGALALGRLLSSVVYGVSPSDPASFTLAAVLQALVTVAACLVPAHRATRADPVVALRAE